MHTPHAGVRAKLGDAVFFLEPHGKRVTGEGVASLEKKADFWFAVHPVVKLRVVFWRRHTSPFMKNLLLNRILFILFPFSPYFATHNSTTRFMPANERLFRIVDDYTIHTSLPREKPPTYEQKYPHYPHAPC